MANSLLGTGMPVLILTPRRSPLRALAGRPGCLGVLDADATEVSVRGLLPSSGRFVVIADDAELLYDGPLDGVLAEVLVRGRDGECALVAAGSADTLGTQYRGFVTDARRSRSGLLISPQGSAAGDLFGIRLPRDTGGGPPGRGLLITSGEVAPVQVAL
jgi:S-DNA-T family DNA segregation ATPase FtsK/SpoIIIE